jgi:hypothetical protein
MCLVQEQWGRDLCKQHVVISCPHTKGSVIVLGQHGNMEVFLSLKGDEITTRGYRV